MYECSKKAFTSVSISSRWTAPSLSQVVRLLVRDSERQSVRVSSLGFGYLVRVTDRIRATTTAQPVCVYFSLDRTRRRVLSQNTQNTWQMWQRNCLIPTVKCRCKPCSGTTQRGDWEGACAARAPKLHPPPGAHSHSHSHPPCSCGGKGREEAPSTRHKAKQSLPRPLPKASRIGGPRRRIPRHSPRPRHRTTALAPQLPSAHCAHHPQLKLCSTTRPHCRGCRGCRLCRCCTSSSAAAAAATASRWWRRRR